MVGSKGQGTVSTESVSFGPPKQVAYCRILTWGTVTQEKDHSLAQQRSFGDFSDRDRKDALAVAKLTLGNANACEECCLTFWHLLCAMFRKTL